MLLFSSPAKKKKRRFLGECTLIHAFHSLSLPPHVFFFSLLPYIAMRSLSKASMPQKLHIFLTPHIKSDCKYVVQQNLETGIRKIQKNGLFSQSFHECFFTIASITSNYFLIRYIHIFCCLVAIFKNYFNVHYY